MIQRHDSIIVDCVSHLLIPFIQVFAVYVLLHGHYSPGGGFQSGVMVAAAFILNILVGSKKELKNYSISREFKLAALGVLIYVLTGAIPILLGSSFFDFSAFSVLGIYEANARYWCILIAEVGITLAVAMTLLIIFNVLAFLPNRSDRP